GEPEVRRGSRRHLGAKSGGIERTSYAEVVLAPPAADAAHPAFSNLSVETECVPELDTLLARRRPRARGEAPVWLAHVAVVEGDPVGELQWETDRARFLGRGRRIRTPAARPWHGRRRRFNSTTSGWAPTRPISSRASPAAFSTRIVA